MCVRPRRRRQVVREVVREVVKEVPVEVIKEVVRTVEVIKEKIVRVIEYRDVIKEVPVEVCQQTPPLPTKVLWIMGGRRWPWAK